MYRLGAVAGALAGAPYRKVRCKTIPLMVPADAQIIIEGWRQHYNTVRPHASLGYKPPAPEVFVPGLTARPSPRDGSAPPAALPLVLRPSLN